MPIAKVRLTLLNGALGVMPPGLLGHKGVIVGPSTDGPILEPVAFARPRDVEASFVSGPMVEYGAAAIGRNSKAAIVVRSNTATDGAYGAVDTTGMDGTSVPTADATVEPFDQYEAHIEFVTGGTIGAAGITYRWSLDGGRTQSGVTSLGTAVSITIAVGNVKIDFGVGTVVAEDIVIVPTTAPKEGSSDFAAACAVVADMGYDWDFVTFATPMTAAQAGTLDTWLEALWVNGDHKAARVSARGPNPGETEAQYLDALAAEWGSFTSTRITVTAGYCEFTSSVTGARQYARPASWITTCRALSQKIKPWRNDLGEVGLGNLGSDVRIRDLRGQRKVGLHDESIDPGLDALGFETLTTLKGRKGAYVTTPQIMGEVDNDYYLWQYTAVANRAADAAASRLLARCRKYIFVNPATGYILDAEARDINAEVEADVRNAVGDSVSGLSFAVNMTDNLLAKNSVITGDLRIVPLAYPAGFDITMGFVNPAVGMVR